MQKIVEKSTYGIVKDLPGKNCSLYPNLRRGDLYRVRDEMH